LTRPGHDCRPVTGKDSRGCTQATEPSRPDQRLLDPSRRRTSQPQGSGGVQPIFLRPALERLAQGHVLATERRPGR